MVLARCPFCTHSNPQGARFCNECGSPLHLRPCEHCEAVNDVLERACYRCGAPLRAERPQTASAVAHGTGDRDDAANQRVLTTVAAAYGDEPPAWQRAAEARPRGDSDVGIAPASPRLRQPAALEGTPSVRREPFIDTIGADHDVDRHVEGGTPSTARNFIIAIAVVVVVTLAALGGYTFLKRGVVLNEAESTPTTSLPSPANSEEETSLPSATSPPEASTPETTTAASEPPPATDERNENGAAEIAKTERRPIPPPKASQDAIETQRIITRELGGFAPPPPR